MSTSLQEQLLKAGLVSEKQVKQVKKDKRKSAKQKKHHKEPVDLAKQAAEQAQKEKAERDRKLNEERNQRNERRAIVAQIRQLIDANRVARQNGEVPYNFVDDKKVKKLYVTEAQHQQLSSGQLAIISFQKAYELVPAAAAQKIAERDKKCVVSLVDKSAIQAEEDEYADYKIPDDLMW